MAIISGTYLTYSAKGIREDLSDVIWNVAKAETPFRSACAKTKATQTWHEWQVDSYANPDPTNARLEGDQFTYSTPVATTRYGNRCQIMSKPILVSGTLEAVSLAGRKKELAYQIAKAGAELNRDIEAVIGGNQADVAGDSATARKLRSVEGWIFTNTDRGSGGANPVYGGAAATDGTRRTFTEALLKNVLQKIYNSGGNPDVIYLGPSQKQTFSGFAGVAPLRHETGDKVGTVIGAVEFYISDFGRLRAVPNRFIGGARGGAWNASNVGRTALILQSDMWALAFLRNPELKDGNAAADGTAKVLITEFTLEARNEASSGVVADLS